MINDGASHPRIQTGCEASFFILEKKLNEIFSALSQEYKNISYVTLTIFITFVPKTINIVLFQSINIKLSVYAEKIAFSSGLSDDSYLISNGTGDHIKYVRYGGR